MKRLTGSILALLVLGLCPPIQAQGVAMVADLQGKASLQRDQRSEPLVLTAEIPAGRDLTLETGSRMVFIALKDGEEITVQGPLTFRLDAQGHPLGPARNFTRKRVEATRLQEALKPGGLAQASLVMRDLPSELEFLAPDPGVREPRPRFEWSAPGGFQFTFVLKDDQGRELARQEGAQTWFELPPGLALPPSATCSWSLEGRGPGGLVRRARGEVTLLAEPLRQALDALGAHRQDSFARGLIYAAALAEAGLRTEARAEWRRLARLRPDDPILQAYAEPAGH
jgi:hypothetical protein